MAIELVSFPNINSMVLFHSYVELLEGIYCLKIFAISNGYIFPRATLPNVPNRHLKSFGYIWKMYSVSLNVLRPSKCAFRWVYYPKNPVFLGTCRLQVYAWLWVKFISSKSYVIMVSGTKLLTYTIVAVSFQPSLFMVSLCPLPSQPSQLGLRIQGYLCIAGHSTLFGGSSYES